MTHTTSGLPVDGIASIHTHILVTVVFVSGRQDLPSDARAYSLKLFITAV